MKRKALLAASVLCLLLSLAMLYLWRESVSGVDEVSIAYDRYRSDGRAASDAVYLVSDHRLWMTLLSGHVGPYNGQLVWGYHVNADQSGGKPTFRYSHSPYATNVFAGNGRQPTHENSMSGIGPIRWTYFARNKNDESFRSITFGVSHGFLALVFLCLSMAGFIGLWHKHLKLRSRYNVREQVVQNEAQLES